jgi:hypothetical protein
MPGTLVRAQILDGDASTHLVRPFSMLSVQAVATPITRRLVTGSDEQVLELVQSEHLHVMHLVHHGQADRDASPSDPSPKFKSFVD